MPSNPRRIVCPTVFSSNLLLERAGSPRTEGRYQFYSLDYFTSEEQALQHSTRWARNWVDTRG